MYSQLGNPDKEEAPLGQSGAQRGSSREENLRKPEKTFDSSGSGLWTGLENQIEWRLAGATEAGEPATFNNLTQTFLAGLRSERLTHFL